MRQKWVSDQTPMVNEIGRAAVRQRKSIEPRAPSMTPNFQSGLGGSFKNANPAAKPRAANSGSDMNFETRESH